MNKGNMHAKLLDEYLRWQDEIEQEVQDRLLDACYDDAYDDAYDEFGDELDLDELAVRQEPDDEWNLDYELDDYDGG